MNEHKHRDEHKIIHKCPKCGNEEGLIVISGQGTKFYYCPICYEQERLSKAAKLN